MRKLNSGFKMLILYLLTSGFAGYSQEMRWGFSISNNITSLPVTTYPMLFYSQFHPGIDVFRDLKIKQYNRNQISLKANAGIFYHRFVQTGVRIYPSIEYQRSINKKISLTTGLGAGYLCAFENSEVFKFANGKYEKKNIFSGRSQYLGAMEIGGSYNFSDLSTSGIRIFFQFKTFIQGTFVNHYVPILPVNSFMLGFTIPIKSE